MARDPADAAIVSGAPLSHSGTAMHALSLSTRIIAVDTPYLRELRDEVGTDWVYLMSELSDIEFRAALEWLTTTTAEVPPDLSGHEWGRVATLSAKAFFAITASRRP